jgi:hypothetical protein
MAPIPPPTDVYNQALDIFDKSHPLRVDMDENLKVTIAGSSTIEIGKVDQGNPNGGGASSWPVAIDQTGDNNDVDVISIVLPPNAAQETGGNLAAARADLDKFQFDGSGNLKVNVELETPETVTVVQPTGTNLHTVIDSGVVTANIGTTGGLALDATLTNSNQKTQIVQGGNTAVVDAAGDLQVDINNFPATQTVAGTVTANQGTANTIASSWPVEVTDGTNVLGTSAHPVRVDPTGATTQPVSGTVTTVPPANASTNLTQVGGAAITEGQKTMANSVPVVLASDQSPVEVELFDSAENGITSQANGSQRALDVGIDVAGVQVDPRSSRTLTCADTVTANQGAPNTVANSWLVEVTDGTNVLGTSAHPVRVDPTGTTTQPVSGTVSTNQITSGTATLSNVSASASSATLLASNASRKQAMIYNDSASNLFVKFGTTASATSFTVRLVSQAYYELPEPVYTGRIDGIWAVANGAARMTELT